MQRKRILQIFVLMAVMVSALGFTGGASAGYCSNYVTVQWGDTLSGIAALCGTTVDAIRAANPGLGWWAYA
ncbi:MAG: LysM peptidoglycan-binding domain-containing protein, partial [Chloroflexota bacterium]